MTYEAWLPIEDMPAGEVVTLRARFGENSRAVLTYPKARLVGFEWYARGYDGYFHKITGRSTLPFIPVAWRKVERKRA